MSIPYAAAIDFSGQSAEFALIKGEELLCTVSSPMSGRDSARFAEFILQQLADNGAELANISAWTIGAGPGNFTGLRLAAALVAGFTFGREEQISTRCVPSAVGLAARLKTINGDRIGCLFDGRNRELVYFEIENVAGELIPTGEMHVLNQAQSAAFFSTCSNQYLVALASQFPMIRLLLDDKTAAKVQLVENIDVVALALCRYRNFDNNLTDLIYIRPAVLSAAPPTLAKS